jgi:aromatic-L-amino-acid decarboxylase
VAPLANAVAALSALYMPLPERPQPAEEVLARLDEFGSPATMATTGGRYFGLVVGGAVPAAVAASCLASVWDQNAALRMISPAAMAFEDVALEWCRDLLGIPAGSGGALVTGASAANLTGLAAARHAVLARQGWDVEADGLTAAAPVRVVVSREVHPAVLKALQLLGFGRGRVEWVEVDGQGRMSPAHLPALDARTIVCIQAGNVNTGACDPALEICGRAHDAGAWVHVDGAFGLWAVVSPRLAKLTAGYSLADSWATDAHKWPNCVYDCGIAFVREAAALRAAMTATPAPYVSGSREREPWHHNPEMSRRARCVELWATLANLGRAGLTALVERTCAYARRFANALERAGFQILNDVVTNQVLVSFGPPRVTRAVIDAVQRDGVCWCGGTEWQGRVAMRISVSSWATTEEDVDASVQSIIDAARRCSAEAAHPPSARST